MNDRNETLTPDRAPAATTPEQYQSPPESIALARETMRNIRAALPRGTDGEFPASYNDVDWGGLNLTPKTAWQDMDMGERYDLLLHALRESVWSLEPPAKWDGPSDGQKLASEFVTDEGQQLHAEWRHDYGLRLLEDRGVKYEDAVERPLDHAIASRDVGPPHPWPSEIAEANRHKQPDSSRDKTNDHDAGQSM